MSGLTFAGDPDVAERADELLDAGLSPRQADVAAMKERGLTFEEIADVLGVTRNTVGTHDDRIRAKVSESKRVVEELGDVYLTRRLVSEE